MRQFVLCAGVCHRGYVDGGEPHHRGRLQQDRRHQHGAGRPDVVGAKLSNNQHKVDQAWDWLRRIWIAWAVINGIGAFIAYVAPLFSGLASIEG